MLRSGRGSLKPDSVAQSMGSTVDEIASLHHLALASGHSGYMHIFLVCFLTVTYCRAKTLGVWLIQDLQRMGSDSL